MVDTFHLVSKWFWNEDFWLPPNITWNDIDPSKNSKFNYASFDDLYVYPWRLVVLTFIYRYLLERCLFRFIGGQLGIRHHTIVKSNTEINVLSNNELKAVKRWDHQQAPRRAESFTITG